MIDVKTMNTYAAIHGTDKLGHGYVTHYAKHLPDRPKSLLEIGAFKGASLRMWKDLFPKAKISCFDLFLDPDNISKEDVEKMGITAYQGDQGYHVNFDQITETFDVIVEDGSHRSDHQRITLQSLWDKVNPGGVYVVEDLHCANESFYWGECRDFTETLLWKLQNGDTMFFEQFRYLGEIFLYDGKIAFLYKKQNDANQPSAVNTQA